MSCLIVLRKTVCKTFKGNWLTIHAVRTLLPEYVYNSVQYDFKGGLWALIKLVSDHCPPFYYEIVHRTYLYKRGHISIQTTVHTL